jgi:mRNA interferase MazF
MPSSANGLKKESLLCLSKFATIEKDLILGRIGSVEQERLREIDEKLIHILQINIQQI